LTIADLFRFSDRRCHLSMNIKEELFSQLSMRCSNAQKITVVAVIFTSLSCKFYCKKILTIKCMTGKTYAREAQAVLDEYSTLR